MESIYREMINDSSMAYIHINTINDEKGIYKGFKVKHVNKAFEMMLNINKKDILNEVFSEYLINENINNIIGKKVTIKKYIKEIDDYFSLDMYKEDEDNIHIIISKVNNYNMKLSNVLKKSPFFVWMKDRKGRYVDINKAYLDFIGKDIEEVIGKTDFDIWQYDCAHKYIEEDNEVIKSEKLYTSKEYNSKTLNNKKIYLEYNKWPYYDQEDKMVIGTIGIAKAVENILELRRSIEENEKIVQDIADNLNEILIIRDEKKAIYISPAFERIYKVSPEELNLYEDMKNWYEYWDEVEFITEPKEFNDADKQEDIFRVRKDGQDIWMWSRFTPIYDEYGNVTKTIGILSDITEAKKIEEEIETIKMDFLANLSHELRTPINLITSCLQLINLRLNNLDEENYNYFMKYINIINQNNMRLLKLVNNLIDTTKISSGNFGHNPKNQDIVMCVEDICMSVCNFIEHNNLNLIFDTNIEQKIISFDEDNMERIILNLLSNAIKFSKDNGTIYVNIEFEKDIIIKVKDEGIGIPKEKLESIFGRFEQVKSKFKKEKEGSGIGLSLVKSLVNMHNGDVCVNSKLGEGSEFIITLPNILTTEQSEITTSKYQSNVNQVMLEFSDICT